MYDSKARITFIVHSELENNGYSIPKVQVNIRYDKWCQVILYTPLLWQNSC